jgi:type IX secretion system PorP/SprF family membrane protein
MTTSGAVDYRLFDRGRGFIGTGVQFYNDMSGASKYVVNTLSIPINYAIQISEENHLAVGLQPAWYSRTMNTQNNTWDNQWTGIEFDPTVSSGELPFATANQSINKFDMAAGLFWYANLSKETRLSFGISGQHLTRQRVNFMGPDSKLYRRFTFYGQGDFMKKNGVVSLMPAIMLFFEGPNKELMMGNSFKFHLQWASLHTGHKEDASLAIGLYYRTNDALIANIVLDLAGLAVGANYDLTASSLTSATSGVGAMEFFLRWKIRFGGRHLSNPQIH